MPDTQVDQAADYLALSRERQSAPAVGHIVSGNQNVT